MSRTAVLVTDGHLRSALAVVRSLGKAGYSAYVCSPRAHSIAGTSRFAAGHRQISDCLTQPEAFVREVATLIDRWAIRVLVPMSEEALLLLLPIVSRFSNVDVPFAAHEIFRQASDKRNVLSMARGLRIPVPDQIVLTGTAEAARLDSTTASFPVVIKPGRSVAGEGAGRFKVGVSYARTPDELTSMLADTPAAAFPLLLQQYIDGPGVGIFLLVWNGTVLARFAHQRIREKPPSGGVSVLAESVAADESLFQQSEALLAALRWQGPAMVEYKRDRSTGRHYLMEVNGRFWGSLQLAIDSGVDFPALLVAAALGECPQPVTNYRVGVRTRWWWGDVDHLIARFRAGDDFRLGTRLHALRHFVWPGTRVNNEVCRLGDPWPAVQETLDWLRRR